ncbi:hypothetical protein OPT61_g4027 [Boeremia exigua]|uniref:Uncharacterized protein n=1 Tax=Boeremia exigua TaxID=749465 RepID=A0ACC2IFQ3_9PLEO|nr:hypothetical protein OPT61_g4027 [Boeremia exigua]
MDEATAAEGTGILDGCVTVYSRMAGREANTQEEGKTTMLSIETALCGATSRFVVAANHRSRLPPPRPLPPDNFDTRDQG